VRSESPALQAGISEGLACAAGSGRVRCRGPRGARAKSISPDLSETDRRARVMRAQESASWRLRVYWIDSSRGRLRGKSQQLIAQLRLFVRRPDASSRQAAHRLLGIADARGPVDHAQPPGPWPVGHDRTVRAGRRGRRGTRFPPVRRRSHRREGPDLAVRQHPGMAR